MKFHKLTKRPKPIKTLIAKYRERVQKVKKQLVLAVKNYKEAVEAERVMAAAKRAKKFK